MPKMKTNKSVAKRIKVTGGGRLRRRSPGAGHLKSSKSSKRLRRFRKDKDVSPGFTRQAKRFSKHCKRLPIPKQLRKQSNSHLSLAIRILPAFNLPLILKMLEVKLILQHLII